MLQGEEHEDAFPLHVQAEEDEEEGEGREPDYEDERYDGVERFPVGLVGCDVVVGASAFEVGVQDHEG